MTKQDLARKTAVEKFTAFIDSLNLMAYAEGLELVDDWRFSNRSMVLLFDIICSSWLLAYTFYLEFPDLECVTLVAGMGYTHAVTNFIRI